MKEICYHSAQAEQSLKAIRTASTTLIEAPVGFGKTRIIQEWIRRQPDTEIIYFTALSTLPYGNYSQLCQCIRRIDEQSGSRLIRIGDPSENHVAEIVSILTDIRCDQECFLILDNFQYFQKTVPSQIILALLWHSYQNLHIIILTQHLRRITHHLLEGDDINYIHRDILRFDAEDILRYAQQVGLVLDEVRVQALLSFTAGCPAMVSMFFERMLNGQTELSESVAKNLLPVLFYDRLSAEEKEILMRISIVSQVTMPFLKHMMEDENRFQEAVELMNRMPFIERKKELNSYELHSTLSSFLNDCRHHAADRIRVLIHKLASDWYFQEGNPELSLYHSYRIHDFRTMFIRCLTTLTLGEQINGVPLKTIIDEILNDCPLEIRQENPVAMVRCAYYLYRAGCFSQYDRLMDEIQQTPEFEKNRQAVLEWNLMAALLSAVNPNRMRKYAEEAMDSGIARSVVIGRTDPFLFSSPCVSFLLYTAPGKDNSLSASLPRIQKIYTDLTDGNGRGADILFSAEMAYLRCEFDDAEILAYKAAYVASAAGQRSLALGASFLLGRIAEITGEKDRLEQILENMLQESDKNSLQGVLAGILQSDFRSAESDNPASEDGINCIYTRYLSCMGLLSCQEYKRAVGDMEAMLLYDERLCTPLVKLYLYIGLAIAYLGIGKSVRASEEIEKALSIAAADHFTEPFVRFSPLLAPLLKQSCVAEKYPSLVEAVLQTAQTLHIDEKTVSGMKIPTMLVSLTVREMEIAEKAAQGMRNREIAEFLHITEGTVKNHLKIIFRKLNIDRRAELIKYLSS